MRRGTGRWAVGLAAVVLLAQPLPAPRPLATFPGLSRVFRDVVSQPGPQANAERLFDFEQVLSAVTGRPDSVGHALDDYRAAFARQVVLAIPGDAATLRRDEDAYRLHSLGYSAREIADLLAGRITKGVLDNAQRMLMAGRPRDRVSDYLDAQYRRLADARRRRPQARGRQVEGPAWAEALVAKYAARHGVEPALARAVAAAESSWDPRARSPAGAVGMMQLMPGTARELGVDPTDAEQNVEGGLRYLAWLLRRFGTVEGALVAYNAGPGYADRFLGGQVALYGETREFVRRVLEWRSRPR